jgi:DNA-binding protein H-NS
MSETDAPGTHTAARDTRRKQSVDLDRLTVQELTALINDATAKRQEKQEGAKAQLLEKWRAEAEEAGMSLDAILPAPQAPSAGGGARKRRADAGKPLPARYRGPSGETWSGRGRMPKWLQTLEAEGRNREEFRSPEGT